MLIVLILEGQLSIDLMRSLRGRVTGMGEGGVRHPGSRQPLKAGHHLSKDVLWHLSWLWG